MSLMMKQSLRSSVAAKAGRTQTPIAVRGAVKCQASKAQKAAAGAAASLPALLAASPAFALVDDRLNGDGVGYALGVNDPALGWVIGGVATLIWIAYFLAQRDFGNFEEDDSGLGL